METSKTGSGSECQISNHHRTEENIYLEVVEFQDGLQAVCNFCSPSVHSAVTSNFLFVSQRNIFLNTTLAVASDLIVKQSYTNKAFFG